LEKILYALNHQAAEESITASLDKTKFIVVGAVTYREAVLSTIPNNHPDILVIRDTLGGSIDIQELLRKVRFSWPEVRIVLITRSLPVNHPLLVNAVRLGIYDIIRSDSASLDEIRARIMTPGTINDVKDYFPASDDDKDPVVADEKNVKPGFLGSLFGGKKNVKGNAPVIAIPERTAEINIDQLRETIRHEERKKLQNEIDQKVAEGMNKALKAKAGEMEDLRRRLSDSEAAVIERQSLIDGLSRSLADRDAELEALKSASATQLQQLESAAAKEQSWATERVGLENQLAEAKQNFISLRNSTNSKINSLQDRLRNAENAKSELKTRLDALEAEAATKGSETAAELSDVLKRNSSLNSEIISLKKSLESAESEKARLCDLVNDLQADTASMHEDLVVAKAQRSLNSEIISLKKSLESAELEKARLRDLVNDLQADTASMHEDLVVAKAQRSNGDDRELESLKAANAQLTKENATLSDELSKLRQATSAGESEQKWKGVVEKLRGELRDATSALKEVQKESAEKDAKIRDLVENGTEKYQHLSGPTMEEVQVLMKEAEDQLREAERAQERAEEDLEEAAEIKRKYELLIAELKSGEQSVSEQVRQRQDELASERNAYAAAEEKAEREAAERARLEKEDRIRREVLDGAAPTNFSGASGSMVEEISRGYEQQIADLRSGYEQSLAALRDEIAELRRDRTSHNENIDKSDSKMFVTVTNISAPKAILSFGATQGVGATTVAINLASMLAKSGKRVLLAEFNDKFPSMNEFFRLTRVRYGLGTAIKAAFSGDTVLLDNSIITLNGLRSVSKRQTQVYRDLPSGFQVIPYSNSDIDSCVRGTERLLRSDAVPALAKRMLLRKTHDYIIFDVQSEDQQLLSAILSSGVFDMVLPIMDNDRHSVGCAVSLLSALSTFGDAKIIGRSPIVLNRFSDGAAITVSNAAKIFNRAENSICSLLDDPAGYAKAEKIGIPFALASDEVANEYLSLMELISQN